jgi:tetratricopeptide repeat protein
MSGSRPWAVPLVVFLLLGAAASADQTRMSPQRKPPAHARRPVRPPTPAAVPELQGEDGLIRVYDAILDARFDQVDAELHRACGPAPPEACDVLAATAIWWRILLDPQNQELDDEFSVAVERAIRTTEAWTVRDPSSAEAWFYSGGAYAARVQWRVLRDEKLAAARDGKRIKQALERAIALDSELDDAYFGIGLYKYYADVAPTSAKILRFFLLLPGGNRAEGLEQMLRARNDGRLLQGEADYQLQLVYLWYERQTARALDLLRGLHRHYPGNPLFLMQIAEVQDAYGHDLTASLATWRTLLSMAREQRVNTPAIAEVQARFGVARQLDALYQTDEAIEQLGAIVDLRPDAPYSALALAYLRLGEAHDRIGARGDAVAAYQASVTAAPENDPLGIRERAADHLRRAPDGRRAEAYRLSLEGWRRLERADLAEARDALERSLTLNPQDGVAHYRLGRVLAAQKNDAAALAEFDRTIREPHGCPAPILATTHLESARLYERAGRRDQAIASYRIAATLFGGAEETRNAAMRALARIDR